MNEPNAFWLKEKNWSASRFLCIKFYCKKNKKQNFSGSCNRISFIPEILFFCFFTTDILLFYILFIEIRNSVFLLSEYDRMWFMKFRFPRAKRVWFVHSHVNSTDLLLRLHIARRVILADGQSLRRIWRYANHSALCYFVHLGVPNRLGSAFERSSARERIVEVCGFWRANALYSTIVAVVPVNSRLHSQYRVLSRRVWIYIRVETSVRERHRKHARTLSKKRRKSDTVLTRLFATIRRVVSSRRKVQTKSQKGKRIVNYNL